METTYSHYYNIVYKIASLSGLWPYLKRRTRIFRVTLLTMILLTLFIPLIAYQCKCKKNVQCTYQAMTGYLLLVVVMTKMYTFLLNNHTMKNLTQHLFCDWKTLKTAEEYEIMKSYAENSRLFSLVYLVYVNTGVIVFTSMSLVPHILDIVLPLNESRPILPPYRGYYFVDIREYFLQIYWHSIVAWEIIMIGVIAHDCMFVAYVEHVCSMFAITGFRYEHVFHNHKEKALNADGSNTDEISDKKIAFIVYAHQEALEYAQLIEHVFTKPFAVQMLIATIGMSVSLLQIMQQEDTLEAIRYVLYVIGQLIHLFFLSFEGQKLIDHSLEMRDKIYSSSWYKASVKLQKLIILVMMKSLHPTFLTAGKIYIFSLQNFTAVLQTSMSYLTRHVIIFTQRYVAIVTVLLHLLLNVVVKQVSSLAGQWPYQKPKTRLFCISLVTLATFSMIVPQMAKFVKCNGDLQCIFHTLTAYLLTVVTLVKLYTCYFNRCKMKILIDQLFVEWDDLQTPEEFEIMKKYAEKGRRYSLGYSLYCFISACLFMSMSLIPPLLDVVLPLNESRPILPAHPGYYFVDDRKYFYFILSHATIAWEVAITGLLAHDCMLVTYVEHVCSIFAITGFRFERLMCKHANSVLQSASETDRKRIEFSVHTHWKALKFAQLIEDTFSLTLAIQIILNTVMISITLLQITQEDADILIMLRYIVYVLAQLIHLFCLSFEGQKLIDHSLQTRLTLYNSPWYKAPTKSQKMLLFVMRKSFQPVVLSAGKIYIFSLENFTSIVQTSMSYFTVLSSLE
ncbi:uncharacterized protein [Anoplolepis gracilipes]|uniref:uncharacterized protein n=1 Tax=Anoplolepis gracilipes TaxID=354296 RepID=UPI003BA16428